MDFPSKKSPLGRKKAESPTGFASRPFLRCSSKANVKDIYKFF